MGGAATRQIRRVSDQALLEAAAEARHVRDLLQRLDLAAYGGNYESIRARLARLGVLEPRFQPSSGRSAVALDELDRAAVAAAAAGAQSVADVLRRLGLPLTRTTYREVRARLLREGIDPRGVAGQAWRGRADAPRRPLEELLVAGRSRASAHLKRRMLQEGLLPARCSMCGITTWRGQPAPLELDHVNGDHRDNRRENLRLLCPNCHAQTPTYRGRNIGRRDMSAPTYSAADPPPG